MTRTVDHIPGVAWVEGTGEFIQVDAKTCTGCGNCLKVCLSGCFEIKEQRASIKSLDTCFECGACWYVCDADAIQFSWPRGGTGFKTDWG